MDNKENILWKKLIKTQNEAIEEYRLHLSKLISIQKLAYENAIAVNKRLTNIDETLTEFREFFIEVAVSDANEKIEESSPDDSN